MVAATELLVAGVLAVGWVTGLGIAYVSSRRRDHPASEPLAKMAGLPAFSSLAFAVLVFVSGPTLVRVLWTFSQVTLALTPAYFLLFSLAYTGRTHWLTSLRRRAVIGFYAVNAAIVGVSGLFFVSIQLQTVAGLTLPVVADQIVRAVTSLVFVLPGVAVSLSLLISFLLSSGNIYRRQTALILAAVLVTLVGNVVFLAGFSVHPGLDLTAVFFAFETLLIALALYRFDLLRIAPMAPSIVLEEIEDPVFVLDDDRVLVDVNPSGRRLIDAAEPVGDHISDLLPDLLDAAENGEPYTDADGRIRADGGQTAVYDTSLTSITDQFGRDRGLVVVLRDITAQKRREETLENLQTVAQRFLRAESEQAVYDIVLETADEVLGYPYSGVMAYDEAENVLRPAAFTDALADRYRGVDADPVVEPSDSDVWTVFESGDPLVGEPLSAASGDEVPVDLGGSLLYPLGDHGVLGISTGPDVEGFSDSDRRFTEILAHTTENALDRISKERQLRESRELLDERNEQIEFFNGVLRHDLLNGMLVIQNHAKEIRRTSEDPAAVDHAEVIERWSEDIADLTEQVRSVSNVVTEDHEPELAAIDVADTLTQKAQKMRESHDSVSLTLDAEAGLPPVWADDLFPSVVENLLVNAVEHNDTDRPELSVTVRTEDDDVVVRIADNGPGIDDEMKAAVFERNVTSDDSGSIGFGLYFVSLMVDRYGGTVRFEDNDPRGTVAVLELPAVGEDG